MEHEHVGGFHTTSHTGSSKDRKEQETINIPKQGALDTKTKDLTLLVGYTESSTIAPTEFFVQIPCPYILPQNREELQALHGSLSEALS